MEAPHVGGDIITEYKCGRQDKPVNEHIVTRREFIPLRERNAIPEQALVDALDYENIGHYNEENAHVRPSKLSNLRTAHY